MKESRSTFIKELGVAILSAALAFALFTLFSFTTYYRVEKEKEVAFIVKPDNK